MSLDLATIGIAMDTSGLDKGTRSLKEAEKAADRTADAADRTGNSLRGMSSYADLASKALASIGLGAAVTQFMRVADSVTQLNNALKLSTGSAKQADQAYSALYESAQRSRVSFIELGQTFTSLNRAGQDMGVSQQRMLAVTEAVGNAMAIGGGSAQSMQAALVQLGQGMSSGVLRGEELNSVMEQAPRLAKALADGLNVPIGKLREMGAAGQITAEQVVRALESQSAVLSKEVAGATLTVGQAFTKLTNASTNAVGEFDKASGASTSLANAVSSIATAMDGMGTAFKDNEAIIKTVMGALAGAAALATLAAIPAAITAIGTALAGLVAILAAPAAVPLLALLGIGALAGGISAYNSAQAKTEEGIRKTIAAMEDMNKRGPSIYARDAESMAKWEAGVAQRKQQIAGLRQELALLSAKGIDTSAEDARLARHTANAKAAKADADAVAKLTQELSGMPTGYTERMAEIIRLNQKGALVGKDYTDALAAMQTQILKKTGAVNGSAAAANAEQTAYESLIASIRAKIEADKLEIEGGAALTESQRIRIKLDQDLAAGRVKLSAQNERSVRLALEELAASEASALAAKTLAKANLDAAAERDKYLTSLNGGIDKLRAEVLAQEEATARMGLSKEAIAELDAAKLEMLATDLELQAIKAMDRNLDQQTYDALKTQAALYRDLAAAKKGQAAKETALDIQKANEDAAKDAAREWKRASDEINNSLTDALMRGFESGKDFAKNMRDTVTNMFKTMVLRPTISAILAPVAGGVTGLLGLSGAANAGQGAGSLMGMASIASSAYNLVSGGLNVASQAGTWLSGKGTELALQYMGESAGTLLNNFALGMSSTSSMSAASAALQGVGADIAGLAVGSVLNGFSGYGISSALSGGYSAGGWVNTVAGIASAIPGVGPIAGVVGGAVNRAFGRKHTQTNLQGTFGGTTGFEGQWEDYYKGGWFRSGKSVYSPLDEETRGALAGQFNAMRVATAAMADVLGLGTDAISNFTASVNIKLKGLSAEDAQKAIQAEFDKIAETLASAALGSEAFSKAGESSVETLTRLSGSLTTVNSAFKLLDIEAWSEQFTASLTGGKNASDYLDKFGGAEVFSLLTASYYDAFYSEAEKTANVTKSITETLASVGLAMPTTREAFRDLTNEYLAMGIYGAETAAVLLGLSGAFAAIVPVTEAVTESVKDMTASLDDYISKTARSSTEAARIRGLASAGNSAALARLGVPGYASGGYHPGGLRLVGEDGPELEVTGPSQIISSPVTADLLRGGGADTARLEALVEKLTAEVANLRAETRAVVTHTATTARIIKRVTPDGDAIATREAAPV